MKTLVLFVLTAGAALAAQPVFEVPEAGGWDRAFVTLGVKNDSDADLKVERGLFEGLSVADEKGTALKLTAPADNAGFTLGPRETLTRRFNLVKLFPDLAAGSKYKVTWAHPLWKDAPAAAKDIEIVDRYVVIELEDYGTIVLRMYAKEAPKTVENFKSLIEKGFYKDLTFHRVLKGFMMQGGCPRGDGRGDPGYKFEDEKTGIAHAPGVLSMANSGPNTNGSQFFICFGSPNWLDGKHTTFGKVIEGLEVVKRVETDCNVPMRRPGDPLEGRPLKPPRMTSVTWHEKK